MMFKKSIQNLARGMAAIAAVSVVLTVTVNAATIVSGTSDFEPRFNTSTMVYDPGPSTTAVTLRTGFQTNFQINSAFFFQLPVLAPGDVMTGARFSATEMSDSATSAVTPTFNADLVALGFTNASPPANTAAESQAYFFLGEGALDLNPGVGGAGVVRTIAQNNFLAPADFIPTGGTSALKQTNAAGNAALLAYISSLYATQGVTGFTPGTSSLILRLNQDIAVQPSGTQRYTLASTETTTGVQLPTLTLDITPVPEPGSLGLFALGAVAVCGWAVRRRMPL